MAEEEGEKRTDREAKKKMKIRWWNERVKTRKERQKINMYFGQNIAKRKENSKNRRGEFTKENE